MTHSWLLPLVLALCVASADLYAQRVTSIDRLAVAEGHIPSTSAVGVASNNVDSETDRNARPIRLVTAVGGTLVGIVVGGTAGYQLLPHDCRCDDPGLDQMIYGAFVGSSIGAAVGAALPQLGSACSFSQRVGRTLVGAGAGGALGFIAGGGLSKSGSSLIVVPVLSVAGALGSLGRCWKTAPEASGG